MASYLILDSEALSALAHATMRMKAQRARAVLSIAHETGALVRVPVAILAEVCRKEFGVPARIANVARG